MKTTAVDDRETIDKDPPTSSMSKQRIQLTIGAVSNIKSLFVWLVLEQPV
jgi:hypothetical protein